MIKRMKIGLRLLTAALVLLALSPGPRLAEADCNGFINGLYTFPCVKCIGAGGFGSCTAIFGDGDCACLNVGDGCISSGGFCDFLIGAP